MKSFKDVTVLFIVEAFLQYPIEFGKGGAFVIELNKDDNKEGQILAIINASKSLVDDIVPRKPSFHSHRDLFQYNQQLHAAALALTQEIYNKMSASLFPKITAITMTVHEVFKASTRVKQNVSFTSEQVKPKKGK